MQRFIALFFFLIAFPVSSQAFDNIEADVFYDGPLLEKTKQEYAETLGGLLKQASALGARVREEDIVAARAHFANKSVMMARCLDKAISYKKMASKKIDIEAYASGCVKVHLQFMEWMQSGGVVPEDCMSRGLMRTSDKPIYDFLQFDTLAQPVWMLHDVVGLRSCMEEKHQLPSVARSK